MCHLYEAAKRFLAMFAVPLSSQDFVFMLENFEFVNKFLLLDFLSLSEVFDIGSIFEFFFSFFVKFLNIPCLIVSFWGVLQIFWMRAGNFRHSEIGILEAFEWDGLIPIP